MDTTNNKVYKGKYYEFTLGKFIGKGGNGIVHECNIKNDLTNIKYAVKIFDIHKWKDVKTQSLRYKMFSKEINTVMNLQENTSGIMKILDYYCPDKIPETGKVWYLMYRAERFLDFCRKINKYLTLKLKYLLDLSNIIIDNLLVIDQKLFLSDFGLIWNTEDKKITRDGERLGPFYIGPPELENRYINFYL